jgi:hypothetical protein
VEQADLGFSNTLLSPKGLFHPQAERMFEYSLAREDPNAGILKEAQKDFSPRVILGIRPCDAKAFELDDANFNTESIKDPWWVQRRETTTMIGLACESPCSTCFCTSMGTGPFDTAGLDVLLVNIGEGYAARALTEKGTKVLEITSGCSSPAGDHLPLAERQQAAEQRIGTAFDPAAIAKKEMLELYNSPAWEEVQFACLNCGACTFVCPTCWCFDIQDEVCGFGIPACSPCSRFTVQGTIPAATKYKGYASVSCTSSNITRTSTTAVRPAWVAAGVCRHVP